MRARCVAKRGLRPDLSAPVVDRWWPHRPGVVVRRLKTRLHVQWSDGEIWRYDAAHARFLRPLYGEARRP
jgi:hypothetical protein